MSAFPGHEPSCDERTTSAVELIIAGRPRDVGTFSVARVLPAPQRRMVGPFIFLDHMGPVDLAPGAGFDVRPHPHIGLSTVTYGLAGENVHRDNLGTVQINRPGDVNLMTAGRGIVHSERAEPAFRSSGGRLHGLQIWLALPDDHEDDAASFEHHPQQTLPEIAPAPGARGRVLLGAAFGQRSPIAHPSRPWLVDFQLDAGAAISVPADEPERAVFVVEGSVTVGADPLAADHLAVLRPGQPAQITATSASRLVLLGGPPVGHRLIYWNFVASSQERIDRAKQAWRDQTFAVIPTDHADFIPLPDEHH